jgi:hypothetical protein
MTSLIESDGGTMVVVTVDVLLAVLGSVVGEEMPAVLMRDESTGRLGLTCSTSVNVADVPAGSVEIEALTVPKAPTGGVVRVKAGPDVCVIETKVAAAPSPSVTATLCASLGPLLAAVML